MKTRAGSDDPASHHLLEGRGPRPAPVRHGASSRHREPAAEEPLPRKPLPRSPEEPLPRGHMVPSP